MSVVNSINFFTVKEWMMCDSHFILLDVYSVCCMKVQNWHVKGEIKIMEEF